MACGIAITILAAALLFAYRVPLKALIVKLRGQIPPTA